jgi:hypothetical protein
MIPPHAFFFGRTFRYKGTDMAQDVQMGNTQAEICSKMNGSVCVVKSNRPKMASGLEDDMSCATTTVCSVALSVFSLSDDTVEWVRPPPDCELPKPEDIFDILPRPSYSLQGGILTDIPRSCKLQGRVPFDANVRVHLGECAVDHPTVTTTRILATLKNEVRLVTAGPAVGGLFCPVQLYNDDLDSIEHGIPGFLFAFLQETGDDKLGLWPCDTLKTLDAEFVRERPVAAQVHAKLGGMLLEKFADFQAPPVQFKDFRFVCHGDDGENTVTRFDCLEESCFWLLVDSNVRKAAKLARVAAARIALQKAVDEHLEGKKSAGTTAAAGSSDGI